jgi:hypothetical protein
MWCHVAVTAVLARRSARFRAKLGPLGALCALALLAIPGAAGAAAGPPSSSEQSLTFPSEKAHLTGSQALILVRCLGSKTGACNGTLTLTTSGNKHKVPFSVIGGTSLDLAVPLGSDARVAKRAIAVARTAQASGGYIRSSEVLHLR